jgi:hypothetical protein
MLLGFVNEYPEIEEHANQLISNFIRSERGRTKSVVRNLGEFLPLLTFSSFTWQQLAFVCRACCRLLVSEQWF